MRIATWNLAGRWSPHHKTVMLEVAADVWLLTEVHHRVTVEGFCSTVLPWRTSGSQPWGDGSTADRTARAARSITENLSGRTVVWGGDWNHALEGPEHAGSTGGRFAIERALHEMQLQAPTAGLTHQTPGHHTIDHVAVPESWSIHQVERVPAHSPSRSLSDHDIYVVDASPSLN